jgi:kynureninase
MISPEQLYQSPNALAPFYKKFHVEERLLLTGHSHQAWPDCGFEGQQQAWLDAAEFLDAKWDRAFEKAELVRKGFARLLDDADGEIALGTNTHELVVRFLSALPLRARPRIVTTDGEFHSLRRQLDRIAEEQIEIVRVRSNPASEVPDLLVQATDDRTAAVIVSSVFFQTGQITPGLDEVMHRCLKTGAELLIDAYHSLNVVSFSLKRGKLKNAFVVGGGYKYCQLGEGNCFFRFPKDCRLRPIATGWFSEFGLLEEAQKSQVLYGSGPARFAGSTYDPTSPYRAAEVFDFFRRQVLHPELLRQVSRRQIQLLAEQFDSLDLNPKLISRDRSIPLENIGGFLALHAPKAGQICQSLRERGVFTDYRGQVLRFGPAPYLSDRQIIDAITQISASLRY